MSSQAPETTALSPTDPAQPSSSNSDHTTTSGSKPTTAFTAITSPSFAPTLESAPTVQKAKSHLLLLCMVVGAVVAAWFLGFELFQVSEHTSWGTLALGLIGVVAGGGCLLYWTGSHYIDWWALVADYWWLSMPVAGAAGLLLVMAQEQATGFGEVD